MNTRELILDTLLALEREEDYSHRLLASVLDKYDYLEARDKAFIKRVTEGTLERQIELDYLLNHYSRLPVKKMRPLIRGLLRMSVYQLIYMDAVPDSAVCNEACKLAAKRGFRDLKGFVNGILRRISRDKESLPLPDDKIEPIRCLSVKHSMPEWLVELWLDEYGWEITAMLLEGLLEIHPVSLRFVSAMPQEEREKLIRDRLAPGQRLVQSPYLPYVYLSERGEVNTLPGFREGLSTVQDVSSALAVEAAGIREEDFVLDVCAAPGGKSLLAAEKAKRGKVLARDVSEEKLALIKENIGRMKAGNIEIEVFDGTYLDERLIGKADVVLLDAPCSGLGVMGKKRDIKYKVTKESMAGLEKLQKQLAAVCVQYIKPGGTLVYSTCTVHSGENQEMVRFISRELGMEPVPLEGQLPRSVLAYKKQLEDDLKKMHIKPAVQLTKEEEAACIQLLPGYMKADGFFIARFRR